MKIVSWNIAGGHTIASLKHLDYNPENIDYFISEIRKIDPDIVCIQESHTKKDGSKSNAHDIASALGYKNVFNSPASKSHIEEGFQLSNAIISKEPFLNSKVEFFPNPSRPLFWKDGRPADTHEKNIQIVDFEGFSVANNQMLPLSLFNLSYDDKSTGSELAHEINKIISKEIKSPVIWCGDFNWDNPYSIYPHIKELGLKEALPNEATRPSLDKSKKKPDHIFYSQEFSLINSGVIETNSDHFLCFAEFILK